MIKIPDALPNPWILNSGAPQPRGEPAHTNAAQPVGSPNLSDGVLFSSLSSEESDPSVTLDYAPSESVSHIHNRDHGELLRELDELIRANDLTCEKSLVEIAEDDDVPLFLRRKVG